ncbi:MAG: hypothetical protein ABSC20_09635 [Candidatus Bathyarchaeia archaeon]|jgi:hypothetical protein
MSATGVFEGTTPLVSDEYLVSALAGSAITMGQALAIQTTSTSFPPTVIPCATANAPNFMGFALTSQPTTGGPITVVCRGVCRAISDGSAAITAGDQITCSATAGQVKTFAPTTDATIGGDITAPSGGGACTASGVAAIINATRTIIGKALTPAVATAGTIFYILVK